MPGGGHGATGVAGDGAGRLLTGGSPGRVAAGQWGAGGRWRRMAQWAAAVVPGLAVVALDGFDLAKVSLWRDEAYTIDVATRSLPQIAALLRHTNAVNGAYYLVMHADIAALGTSTAAVRLPSLIAMAVAAVVTSVTGRRLARATALPAPALTGMLAGLLLAVAPEATRYSQDARCYAIVTMMAVIATYLLLRGIDDGRWRWWAGYGVAVAVAGLFSVLALLLVVAHAVTLLIVCARRRRTAAAPGRPGTAHPLRWLVAAAAAGAALTPLLLLGYEQRSQIGWLHRPGPGAVRALVNGFAGSSELAVPVALLAAAAVVAAVAGGRRRPLDVAVVALPWLVVPPAILLAVSQIHPVYDGRYVVFCLPALALLTAAGLAWLARAAAATPLAEAGRALVWLPTALAVVMLAALTMAPQRAVRSASSRPDNLRAGARILAARVRPGDVVFYIPANRRVDSVAYPAAFSGLRDIALGASPVAASNLLGRDVTPAVLRRRFAAAGVRRVWVVSGTSPRLFLHPRTGIEKTEVALLATMHLTGHWRAGSEMLRLFVRG